MPKLDWRQEQKNFASEDVELLQDQRILDFFDKSPIYGLGNVDYFLNKLNILEADPQSYTQALVIINDPTSDLELFNILDCTKNIDKVCVSINKYLLWSKTNKDDIVEDYDIALLEYIKKIFKDRHIKHFYVEGLKGRHFNFASPTTQFFITNENN